MKSILSSLMTLLMLVSMPLHAIMIGEEVAYQASDEDVNLKGYLIYNPKVEGKRPGVLVVHEWWGHNDYARKRARMLAAMGYTALAVDMYGDGKQADHPKEASQFVKETLADMDVATARFVAAMDLLKQHATVNADHIAAIGYCFGGGIVLGAARSGLDLDGVASFHGSLGTDTPAQAGEVKAKVAVFTGEADPMVPPEQVKNFIDEMEQAGVDYRLFSYPDAVHSFTTPEADKLGEKFDLPLAYNVEADHKSWAELQKFLKEIFAEETAEAAEEKPAE